MENQIVLKCAFKIACSMDITLNRFISKKPMLKKAWNKLLDYALESYDENLFYQLSEEMLHESFNLESVRNYASKSAKVDLMNLICKVEADLDSDAVSSICDDTAKHVENVVDYIKMLREWYESKHSADEAVCGWTPGVKHSIFSKGLDNVAAPFCTLHGATDPFAVKQSLWRYAHTDNNQFLIKLLTLINDQKLCAFKRVVAYAEDTSDCILIQMLQEMERFYIIPDTDVGTPKPVPYPKPCKCNDHKDRDHFQETLTASLLNSYLFLESSDSCGLPPPRTEEVLG